MIFKSNEELIQSLVAEGYLRSKPLIEAFQKIDRADFVPEEYKNEAYANYPLPIGYGQTISQPLTVAFMLELLEPASGEKILDIGSGSGWQTALLAEIVSSASANLLANLPARVLAQAGASAQAGVSADKGGKVVAIEIIPELAKLTEQNVSKLNFIQKNAVAVVEGDGTRGARAEAPFDKIIAAAAGKEIPPAWKEQLKIGGRIVAPVGGSICVFKKVSEDKFSEKCYFGFAFVPLVSDS